MEILITFSLLLFLIILSLLSFTKKEEAFKDFNIIPDAAEMASLAASSNQKQSTEYLERIADRIKIAAHNGNRCVFITNNSICLNFDKSCKKYLQAKGYKVKRHYYGEDLFFDIYLEVRW